MLQLKCTIEKNQKRWQKDGITSNSICINIHSICFGIICSNANKTIRTKSKDFWDFIEANEMLDKLNKFAKQYQAMSPQEQVIYLTEAEKIFTAFDKVPEELWDEEYEKYKQVLKKYNDIKMFRWASS